MMNAIEKGPFVTLRKVLLYRVSVPLPLLLVVTSGDERFLISKKSAAAAWGQVYTFDMVQMYTFATLSTFLGKWHFRTSFKVIGVRNSINSKST